MSKHNRRTPSFPSSPSTIEASEPVFHPGTEVLAAEAAHHEAVDALGTSETNESASQTPAEAPEQDYTLGGGRYESGAPSVVGLGNGEITPTGQFQPKGDGKGFVVDMDALVDEAELDARIDAQLKAAMGSTAIELPDGSIRIPIIVDADKIIVLREWANGAGESFEDYLTKMVDMGLEAIVNGGAVAG